jgi:radical SAM superfamily enzyme YgiQ (UPF0313 family)
MLTIPAASIRTEVLLIHAPYPGRLKFDALPSSLLYAAAPLAQTLFEQGRLHTLGLLDPGSTSPAFDEGLRELLTKGAIRVVAISTSTAAIEETARIVATVRELRGSGVLIVVGGPHEDDCEEKVAARLPGVDFSIAGEAGYALERVVLDFLEEGDPEPNLFATKLSGALARASKAPAGRFAITSRWWGTETQEFDGGPLPGGWLGARPLVERSVAFSMFLNRETLPVLVSTGCSYGQCSFCAEGRVAGGREVLEQFDGLVKLHAARPKAAFYFQDSIFPSSVAVRDTLLPLLRGMGVLWGAQVYLGTITQRSVQLMAQAGCGYLYTGLESASPAVLGAIGKRPLPPSVVLERLGWLRDAGVQVGLSLMFGTLGRRGELIETEETIDATRRLVAEVRKDGVDVAGVYPNVETVLPGTRLARNLAKAGYRLDFYRMPRAERFAGLEDGAVGYNFLTLPAASSHVHCEHIASRVVQASTELSAET